MSSVAETRARTGFPSGDQPKSECVSVLNWSLTEEKLALSAVQSNISGCR